MLFKMLTFYTYCSFEEIASRQCEVDFSCKEGENYLQNIILKPYQYNVKYRFLPSGCHKDHRVDHKRVFKPRDGMQIESSSSQTKYMLSKPFTSKAEAVTIVARKELI